MFINEEFVKLYSQIGNSVVSFIDHESGKVVCQIGNAVVLKDSVVEFVNHGYCKVVLFRVDGIEVTIVGGVFVITDTLFRSCLINTLISRDDDGSRSLSLTLIFISISIYLYKNLFFFYFNSYLRNKFDLVVK